MNYRAPKAPMMTPISRAYNRGHQRSPPPDLRFVQLPDMADPSWSEHEDMNMPSNGARPYGFEPCGGPPDSYNSESYNKFDERRGSPQRHYRGWKTSSYRPYGSRNSRGAGDSRDNFNRTRRPLLGSYRGRGTLKSSFHPYQSENYEGPGEPESYDKFNKARRPPQKHYRGRGGASNGNFRCCKSENYRKPGDSQAESSVEAQRRPETFWDKGPKPNRSIKSRLGRATEQTYVEARDFNQREFRDENCDSNKKQERDSSTNERKRKLELDNLAEKQSIISTNQSKNNNFDSEPSTTKLKLKRYENVPEDTVMSKQNRCSVNEKATFEQNRSKNEKEEATVEQSRLTNEEEVNVEQSRSINKEEEAIIKKSRSINEEGETNDNQSSLNKNETVVKQSMLINEEKAIIKQSSPINEQIIVNQSKSVNEEETIASQNILTNEKEVILQQRRSINEEVIMQQIKSVNEEVEEKEKDNAHEDTHVNYASNSTLTISNIDQLKVSIIPRLFENNVRQYVANDKKAEMSAQDKTHSRKKIMNNSVMQLKLFLLECNRKLKDDFKVFYISKVNNASEITEAIFSFEKENTRNLFLVKYLIQEFRSYKKINYRALTSNEFNLNMIYNFFKKNENIDQIIIYSNLELDAQSLKKRNIRVIKDKSRGTQRLEVNEESTLYKKMIDKNSIIPKLAEYLDECMRTEKPVVLKGLMKECHTVLMTENVITITGIEGRKQIGKLHPRFINSPDNMLKPAIAQLRSHLKSLNFGELRVDRKLILGENFGKESCFQHSQPELLVHKLFIGDSMKKFFEKLKFMECEKNIDYCILRELGEKFEYIYSDFHIQAIKEELFTRLQPGSDQTGLFQALERKILSCDLSNYHKKKNSKEMKLEFELNTLQNLKAILTQSNKSTIVIKSDYPSLCDSKIQQVVKNLDKYSEGQYFFLDVDEVLAAKDNLLTAFSTPLEHLLVIQTEGANLKSEQLNDCIKCLRQSISNDSKCGNKIVLIQNISDPSFNFYVDVTEHKKIFNHEVGLTKAIQDKLSETMCESYGLNSTTHTATLKELILESCDLSSLLASAQCVDKLVKGKVIIGEKLVKPIIFESTSTMPRRLKRHILVNSAALKEENEDTFFLFGDEKESKMNKVHYFKDFNSALSSFKQFTMQNKKLNAHLLKYVSVRGLNHLIWQRSSGSVNTLMKYLVENSELVQQSEPISDVLACRIMILSGKSGSGKSHYLFELALRLQSSNQNLEHWVVQLNLNNSLMEQYADSPLSSTKEAVDHLTKILGYDELCKQLFRLCVFGKLKPKLSLFIDGLEKLRADNACRVYQILHLLRKTEIRRIYVTTRPEFKKILEQRLGEFAYNLDSLTQDEQKNFLTSTWISLADQAFAQYGFNDYVNELCNVGDLLDLIIEPLYLNIFSIVFWFCVKDGQRVPNIHRIYDIYREYLDKFLNNLEQSRKEIFDKSFSILSLKSLLHPDDFRKLNLPEVQSSDVFAKLNHSSFAEYGAAKWLASLLLQEQITAFNIMEDLAERASVVFVETFALSCKEFRLEYIQQIGDNRLVVRLFTQHLWDDADDYQKQKYLQEAVRMNRVKLVSELMLRSMEIKLPTDFLMQVAVYVISILVKDKPKKSHPYWSLSETLLEQVPQATAGMDPGAQLPQLLVYLFARGRYEVVSKVFQSIGDREKEERILRIRVDGRTPLEIVNSSALMTDEQRLATSKFLIERDYSKDNVHSVMKAAAKHGHVQCFEYFAGKSSEVRSNFLKDALKSNQLDVLRFLLNNSDWTRDSNLAKNHPLHTAVTEGVSLRTIEFLLTYGGVNNSNSNGETALCVAIKAGVDLRMIKLLVEREADVNAKDKQGLHAWCYAVLKQWCRYSPQQQLELMRFLKNKNCNLRLPHPDDYQLTCRIKEIERKYQYLWEPESYDLDDHNGTPRLHTALLEKDLDWFGFLLRHGADIDILDSQNRTALHLAVKMKKDRDVLDTVRLLLRYGATFNAVDPSGKTPLDLLRSSANATDDKGKAYKLLRHANDLFTNEKCIEQLKKELSVKDTKAAKSTNLYWILHCRDSQGRTLAHRMAEQNIRLDDFNKLLQFSDRYGNKECSNGSWLDTRDNLGENIVDVVARLGNYKILRELVRRGASLNTKNNKLTKPLSSDSKSKEFLKLVNQTFASVQRGSLESLHFISRDSSKYLVKARDGNGRTLLHLAASGHSSVTRTLLCEWNANANVVDDKGRTPLHYALEVDDLESAKMLVKAGASIDVRDKNGKQPADLENLGCKSVEMVNTLNEILERCWRAKLSATELNATIETLSKKFDLEPSVAVNARDSVRDSMVHHAVRNHEPELLKGLLKHGAVYNALNASNKSPTDLADGEIKELLASVFKLFKYPKVATWEDKKDTYDWEIMSRCRRSGGYTILHTALEAKKIEEAKWLMDRGADVNVTNDVGASALKLAEGLELIVV